MLVETVILTSLRAAFFFGCRKYLLRILYSDLKGLSSKEDIELDSLPAPSTTPKSASSPDTAFLHGTIARTLFSWTLAECCMLFVLLILQGVNVFSSSARLANWRFSLFFLVTTIIVTIPASYSIVLAVGNAEKASLGRLCGPRALLNLIPVALFLFAFSYIPLPSGLSSANASTSTLSRLIVVGTIFLGALSGFGAMNNACELLTPSRAPPSDAQIRVAEQALLSVQGDLRQRRLAASRRDSEAHTQSWFSRVGTSLRGGDDASQEMRGLESLEYQMRKNLEAMRLRRDVGFHSSTTMGRLSSILQRLFAVYCITRILSCLYNVAFLPSQRSSSNLNYSDLLANVLAYGFAHTSANPISMEDAAAVSRQISLGLVGIIILSSIRLVLRGVTKILHVTSRSMGASLMILFLAQVMATYLLSTVIQMRATFPPPPPTPDVVNLFSTVPQYEVFNSLFDWAFIITATATAAVRWGAKKVAGSEDD